MNRRGRRYGGEEGGLDQGRRGGTPGKRTLSGGIQRKASGDAAATTPSPGAAFGAATSGSPTALPHQARMELAFGHSFQSVTAHVGTPEAQSGLADLGARAAAFGEHVAFADASPDEHLVAHELAHVVQSRNGGGGMQAKAGAASSVSEPHDAAELAADRAADAVVRGQPVPDVGTADGITLHRTVVNSNGGTFDNGPMYAAVSGTGAVGERVGANIMVDFTPNDLVEAPANGIALIQTVTSQTDRVGTTSTLHPTRDQTATIAGDDDQRSIIVPDGQAGARGAIDLPIHHPGRNANTNPLYGVGFSAAAPSASLRDGTPTVGRTARGSHVRHADGTFDPAVPAKMEDGAGRVTGVAGQSFAMQFELAAMVTDGPMANTYLGSIEWGWQSDAAGLVTLRPFVPLASGSPTAGFMGAAKAWNAATFHNTDGTTADSIDLPITTLPSGVRAAVDMTTVDIIARLRVVDAALTAFAAGPSVDRTNKEFERRALDTELRRRNVTVNVQCNRISDTGGAAQPAEDEVWLWLDTPAGAALTGQRTFRAGDVHRYSFSVASFLPLDGPIHVEINEHDRAGPRASAHDDALVSIDWAPPFAPRTAASSGGEYQVTVQFDR